MAFNLYCNGTPSVLDYDDAEKQVNKSENSVTSILEFLCKIFPNHLISFFVPMAYVEVKKSNVKES